MLYTGRYTQIWIWVFLYVKEIKYSLYAAFHTTYLGKKGQRKTCCLNISQCTFRVFIFALLEKCVTMSGLELFRNVANSLLVLVHLAPLKLFAIYTFPKAGQLGYKSRPLRSCHLTILNLDFPPHNFILHLRGQGNQR